jgi:transposase-like protein
MPRNDILTQTAKLSPKIFGIDSAFMKFPKYKGQLILFTGRDPMGYNLDLAVALCAAEDAENYNWFFGNLLRGAGFINSSDVVIFSDRDKGLEAALAYRLPHAVQFPCLVHILRNLEAHCKKSPAAALGRAAGIVWAIARASSLPELNAKWEELEAANPSELGIAPGLSINASLPRS